MLPLKATPATSLVSIISDDVRVALTASLCIDELVVFGRVSVRYRFHRGLSGVCPTCAFGVYAHNYG